LIAQVGRHKTIIAPPAIVAVQAAGAVFQENAVLALVAGTGVYNFVQALALGSDKAAIHGILAVIHHPGAIHNILAVENAERKIHIFIIGGVVGIF
jgi:hypothetical protein